MLHNIMPKDIVSKVTWHPASDPPDDDTTVLLFDPNHSEPVWPGHHSEGQWHYEIGNAVRRADPTLWAHFPHPQCIFLCRQCHKPVYANVGGVTLAPGSPNFGLCADCINKVSR